MEKVILKKAYVAPVSIAVKMELEDGILQSASSNVSSSARSAGRTGRGFFDDDEDDN